MRKMPVLEREPRDLTDAGTTEARILSSAITLFAERGFDQVTVRDIAVHAEANPAAIC
jgi:AcrR family transcriptional regulator